MKKAALLLCCCLAALAGCGGDKPQREGPLRIGVSLPSLRETRWAGDLKLLREQAAALGVELLSETAANSAAQQREQCDKLLAAGVAALIIAPHDGADAAAIAAKAAAAGVKVVAYDRLITGAPVDLYVSFDSEQVGALQARALTAAAPRGNYIVLSGAPTDSNAALYRKGAMQTLQPLFDDGQLRLALDAPVADWNPAEARVIMDQALELLRGDVRAVLAPNDTIAGAVIDSLAARGLAGRVAVSGQDAQAEAARRILAGTQTMTVFKDTRQLAAAAFGAAMTLAAGGSAPAAARVNNGSGTVPALLLQPVAVTRENLGKTLVAGGFLKAEKVYGPQGDAR